MLHNGSLLGLTSLFGGPLCVHFIMLCARITHYPSLDLDTAEDFFDIFGIKFHDTFLLQIHSKCLAISRRPADPTRTRLPG